MSIALPRPFGQRYAFIVVGVIFLSLLASAGLRAAPGVLMVPLEGAFGWSRATISSSAALGIFLYGMVGPFAAAIMQRFGIKRTLMGALALMSVSTASSYFMTEPWQLVLSWGVFSGLGSGCVTAVMGAAIVNRWFITNRGLVMGLLTASTATGTLIFLPGLAAIAEYSGWQYVVLTIALCLAALIPVVLWLLPEKPADIGLTPYGAPPGHVVPSLPKRNVVEAAIGGLVRGLGDKNFWLLAGTFFVCGFTTNGLVGTHMISLCSDHGMPEVQAASLLAMMGVFDLIGTTASGWLTDRFDPRKLLFMYYGLRGLSLIYLPYADFSFYGLSIFAIFYGLDWIATVPPTLRLTNECFGDQEAPVMFGWILAAHQIGAASATFFAGMMRTIEGRYLEAFVIAGTTGLIAAGMALFVGRSGKRAPVAA
ncbi:MAG TPA: MFS transporter [Hypericibacter adhaerens]|jgi:predicted MFS family arabinose efflux permease|uniref:Membrane protein n=1 Tax=Hypericibacter adhaerens TaxID=2602016 RepID=A0A5J6N4A6_9PROT|nr:MFS transporter [Hypericibacter adhaerens]QEX24267.1 membrane protein [Hypericibacter adhaerens]HWA46059.1 MFS transporter [Hypericibacter adhaerens]